MDTDTLTSQREDPLGGDYDLEVDLDCPLCDAGVACCTEEVHDETNHGWGTVTLGGYVEPGSPRTYLYPGDAPNPVWAVERVEGCHHTVAAVEERMDADEGLAEQVGNMVLDEAVARAEASYEIALELEFEERRLEEVL